MEIILKQDVQNLGYADDLVKVKDGYARNYLIPQGLAELATPAKKKMLAETLKQREFKAEKIRKDIARENAARKQRETHIRKEKAEKSKTYER